MQTQHLEVIPRIIDASIAVNYQKAEPLATSAPSAPPASTPTPDNIQKNNAAMVAAPTFTQRFFTAVKDYMIPILFVIVVIVCIYILWKYFTKYRTSTEEPIVVHEALTENTAPDKPDLSKYVFDANCSDDEETDSKLSVIEEESGDESGEESDEESGEDESGEESDEDESGEDESGEDESGDENEESGEEEGSENDSLPSLITEPDLNAINNLINQSIDHQHIDTFLLDERPELINYNQSSERFEYISPTPEASENENESDDMFNLSTEESKPKARRARKSKRVVL